MTTETKKKIIELTNEGWEPKRIWNYLQNNRDTQWMSLNSIRLYLSRNNKSFKKAMTAKQDLIEKMEDAGLDSESEGLAPLMKEVVKYKLERSNYDYPEDPQEILELFRNIAEEQVIKFRDDPLLFGICTKIHQNILDSQMKLQKHNRDIDPPEEKFNITFNLNIKEK